MLRGTNVLKSSRSLCMEAYYVRQILSVGTKDSAYLTIKVPRSADDGAYTRKEERLREYISQTNNGCITVDFDTDVHTL
jgi:hypothetical protein